MLCFFITLRNIIRELVRWVLMVSRQFDIKASATVMMTYAHRCMSEMPQRYAERQNLIS